MKRYGMTGIPNYVREMREPYLTEWQRHHDHKRKLRKYLRGRARMQAKQEMRALAAMSDDQIDTTDAPEIADWSNAQRGLFYRPAEGQKA